MAKISFGNSAKKDLKDRMHLKVKISVSTDKKNKKKIKIPLGGNVAFIQNKDGHVYFKSNSELHFALIDFNWDGPRLNEKQITTTKKKGTLGRAVVGGVIAGPIGSVVGASSAKAKSETHIEKEEWFSGGNLELKNIDSGEIVTFRISLKSYEAEIIQEMVEYYKNLTGFSKGNSSEKDTNKAAEQIREFKQLLDEGILTQEEFDEKKQQLLNLDQQEENK